MSRLAMRVGGWIVAGFLSAGCRPEAHAVRSDPAVAATMPAVAPAPTAAAEPTPAAPAPPAPSAPPARVETILVPGDQIASIVRAADGAPPRTVFLPGVCSNAGAYLATFPAAAQKNGGAVAVDGDQPCGPGMAGFHTFSWDAAKTHARVEAALAAAGVVEIPKEGITLVGYSQGASLAEQMVQRWPGRYARVVLIGAPTNPATRDFARARALVTMSCDRDVPARMKGAADATRRAGIPATYFEMPGCTHGSVADGERIFGATFDWLRANERPLGADAEAVRIAER